MTTDNKKVEFKNIKDKGKVDYWRSNKRGWKLFAVLMGLVVMIFLIGSLCIQCNCNGCNDNDHGHGNPVPTATHATATATPTPHTTVVPTVSPTASQLEIVDTVYWEESMVLLRGAFPNASMRGSEGAPYSVPTKASLEALLGQSLHDLSSEAGLAACLVTTNVAVGTAKESDNELIIITIASSGGCNKLFRVTASGGLQEIVADASVIYCVLD